MASECYSALYSIEVIRASHIIIVKLEFSPGIFVCFTLFSQQTANIFIKQHKPFALLTDIMCAYTEGGNTF